MKESYRRSYEPSVEKLKAQPAGASGGRDHGEEEPEIMEKCTWEWGWDQKWGLLHKCIFHYGHAGIHKCECGAKD